jgi:membrane dipeptidase
MSFKTFVPPAAVGGFPALKQYSTILDQGATESRLAPTAGENIIRVWQDVDTSERLQDEDMVPVEDTWEKIKWSRYDGSYQMFDPDPEDKLGLD